jgi:hypothetical protein
VCFADVGICDDAVVARSDRDGGGGGGSGGGGGGTAVGGQAPRAKSFALQQSIPPPPPSPITHPGHHSPQSHHHHPPTHPSTPTPTPPRPPLRCTRSRVAMLPSEPPVESSEPVKTATPVIEQTNTPVIEQTNKQHSAGAAVNVMRPCEACTQVRPGSELHTCSLCKLAHCWDCGGVAPGTTECSKEWLCPVCVSINSFFTEA